MLRKASHIILSMLLLIATIGFVVSKHYCNGQLVSVTLLHEAHSCCGDSDCCHNEDLLVKVKNDFSSPVISTVPELAGLDILGNGLLNTGNMFAEPELYNTFIFRNFSPPPKTTQAFLSLKQVYLL